MSTGSNIRVSDAERDAVAAQLREHYGDGRLTLDELNERLDRTFAARTGADLQAVTKDLPSSGGAWTGAAAGAPQLTGPDVPSAWDARSYRGSQSGWNGQDQWTGQPGAGADQPGFGRRRGLAGSAIMISALIALWAVVFLGGLIPGLGSGRPFAFVILLAVIAFIRRMFSGRGRSGRRSGGCGRRW